MSCFSKRYLSVLTLALLATVALVATPLTAESHATPTRLGLPPIGTMKGLFGTSGVSLTFDRRQWTIRGMVEDSLVSIDIDHDACTITGLAHGEPVGLTFDWSSDRIVYGGYVYGAACGATVDWKTGTLSGRMAGRPMLLHFSLNEGWVRGSVGGQPTSLRHEPVSGTLKGIWAGRTMNVRLVNLDLSDFLQNTYLFLD